MTTQQPAYRTPANAGWILICITCGVSLIPFLGFGAWLLAIPLLLVAFILAIVVLSRGGTAEGLLLLFASFLGAPLFIAIAPFVSVGFVAGLSSHSPTLSAHESSRGVDSSPSPTWEYTEDSDNMANGAVKQAAIKSSNTVTFRFPYSRAQHAVLALRKHPRHGNDVILQIEQGQFLCAYDGCQVTARFDDESAQTFRAVEPADHRTTTLFIKNYNDFVSQLRRANRLRIEANFYQEGSRVFDFDVAGLSW